MSRRRFLVHRSAGGDDPLAPGTNAISFDTDSLAGFKRTTWWLDGDLSNDQIALTNFVPSIGISGAALLVDSVLNEAGDGFPEVDRQWAALTGLGGSWKTRTHTLIYTDESGDWRQIQQVWIRAEAIGAAEVAEGDYDFTTEEFGVPHASIGYLTSDGEGYFSEFLYATYEDALADFDAYVAHFGGTSIDLGVIPSG